MRLNIFKMVIDVLILWVDTALEIVRYISWKAVTADNSQYLVDKI